LGWGDEFAYGIELVSSDITRAHPSSGSPWHSRSPSVVPMARASDNRGDSPPPPVEQEKDVVAAASLIWTFPILSRPSARTSRAVPGVAPIDVSGVIVHEHIGAPDHLEGLEGCRRGCRCN